MAKIEYENHGVIEENDQELTLLEISNKNGIAHTQACGGNGRCSTCRVLVLDHIENILPRNETEIKLASKKGCEANIRLACQAKIKGDVKIRLLIRDQKDLEIVIAESGQTTGREQRLAILFSDIRGFTTISENMLPYDVVHILNRYFLLMGESVLKYNGYIDKYMGDGLMALFGINETDPEKVCLDAISSAREMLQKVNEMDLYLKEHFEFDLQIGVGIHYGEAILGEIGHPQNMQLTAMGDSVNTASRIESICKKAGANFLVSEELYSQLKNNISYEKVFRVELKGKKGQYRLFAVSKEARFDQHFEKITLFSDYLYENISLQLAPKFLRLAFHDVGDYVPDENRGGANASIRFKEIISHESNHGLEECILLLEGYREQLQKDHDLSCSMADLIIFAGAAAVKKCGGPEIPLKMGRKDAETIDEAGDQELLPPSDMKFEALLNRFWAMGLYLKDLVALSGAHTVGKANNKPFTDDLFSFNNSYFVRLLREQKEKDHLTFLDTDTALLENEEASEYVRKYAVDQEAFFRDFTDAYQRMSMVNVKL